MTQQVTIHDPAVTVESVVDQVRHGEEAVLLDQGRPVPIPAPPAPRIPGLN